MAEKEARITLAVDGADQSVTAIDRVKGALQSVGGVSGAVSSAVGSIASSLSQLGQDAVRVVSGVNSINLAAKVEEVRQLDLAVQHLATAGAGNVRDLSSEITAVGKATNQSEMAVRSLADALGKATYDFHGAIAAQKGLGEQALFTGRTPQEMQALGKSLHDVLGVTGDTTVAIGRLNAQAQMLGTTGGPAAFADMFVSLSGTLSRSVSSMGGAREQAMALVGTVTHGMRPEAAAAGGSSLLSSLQGNYFDLNYTLGYDILDENGQVRDPAKVLRDLDKNMQRRGLSRYQRRQALRSYAGPEMGSRIFQSLEHGDLSEEAMAQITGAAPSTAAHEAASAYQSSQEGQAEAARQQRDRSQRNVARSVKDAQDMATSAFADHPILGSMAGGLTGAAALSAMRVIPGAARMGLGALGLGGSAAAETGAAAIGAGAASSAGGMSGNAVLGAYGMEALAGGGTAATLGIVVGGLGLAATQLLLAGQLLGQDRGEMGREWRAEHGVAEGADPSGSGDEEFSVGARGKKEAARKAKEAADRKADPLLDFKRQMAFELNVHNGNAAEAEAGMSVDMKQKINQSPELRKEWARLAAGGGDVRDEARVHGEELSRQLRSGGPLPVYLVQAPGPAHPPVARP